MKIFSSLCSFVFDTDRTRHVTPYSALASIGEEQALLLCMYVPFIIDPSSIFIRINNPIFYWEKGCFDIHQRKLLVALFIVHPNHVNPNDDPIWGGGVLLCLVVGGDERRKKKRRS